MAGEIASMYVRIGAKMDELDKALSSTQAKLRNFGVKAGAIGAGLTFALTRPILAFAGESVRAFQQQEAALAKVANGIKATGGTAKLSLKELADEASRLQKVSMFGDEEILDRVTAQLLTFRNVSGDTFKRAQQAALDLSATLGQDLQSSAIQLGKALDRPKEGVTALQRVGVTFSAAQKQVIESLVDTNRMAEAQAVILDELAKQYGGSAATQAETFAGKVKQLHMRWGDFTELLGQDLAPMLSKVVGLLGRVMDALERMDPTIRRVVIGVGLFAAGIGPVLAGLGLLSIALGSINVAMLLVVAKVALVVSALAALSAGVYLVVKNWEFLKAQTVKIWSEIVATVAGAMAGLLDSIVKVSATMSAIGATVPALKPLAGALADAAGEAAAVGRFLRGVEQTSRAAGEAAAASSPKWRGLTGEIAKVKDAVTGSSAVLPQLEDGIEGVGTYADTAATKVQRLSQYIRDLKPIRGDFRKEDFRQEPRLAPLSMAKLPKPDPTPFIEGVQTAQAAWDALVARMTEGTTQATVNMAVIGQAMRMHMIDVAARFADVMGTAFADVVTGMKSASNAIKDIGASLRQLIRDLIATIAKAAILAAILALIPGAGAAVGAGSGAGFGAIFGRVLGGMSGMPAMAEGGIVNRPTVALIGERGPEAVVPLNKLRSLHPPNIEVNVAAPQVEVNVPPMPQVQVNVPPMPQVNVAAPPPAIVNVSLPAPNLSSIEVALRDLAQVRPVAPVTIEPMQPMAAQMQQPQPPMQPVLRVGIGELWVEMDRYGRENGLHLGG